LYVCDAATPTEGYIYQYEIEWDEDDTFELKSDSYSLVYTGSAPQDCAVDSIGNLYFSTLDDHIYGFSYDDLFTLRENAIVDLADNTSVRGCAGIDVRKDGELYFTNFEETATLGTLAKLKWKGAKNIDSREVTVELTSDPASGLATTENDAYYTSEGQLFAYNFDDKETTTIATDFVNPTSVAYGGR